MPFKTGKSILKGTEDMATLVEKEIPQSNPGTGAEMQLNFLWLEITRKCNLTCRHCYADSGPTVDLHGEMTFQDWQQVLSDAQTLGCSATQFIGGEPTLNPHLEMLIEHARSLGFTFIEVFTNATRINKALVHAWRTNQVQVACSFYSTDAKIHDQITNAPGSFRRTVDGIKTILDAGISLRVGLIETSANQGQMTPAHEFLTRLGVQQIKIDRERGVGRAGIQIEPHNPMNELCGQCSKGKLCVTAEARCYPCVFSRFIDLGDARSGLRSILSSQTLQHFKIKLDSLSRLEMTHANPGCNPYGCPPYCGPHCNPGCNPVCNPCNPQC